MKSLFDIACLFVLQIVFSLVSFNPGQRIAKTQTLRTGQNRIANLRMRFRKASKALFKQKIACDLRIANEVGMGLELK